MVNELIKYIYDNTLDIVSDTLSWNTSYEEKYKTYLLDKYMYFLEKCVSEETGEHLQAILKSCIDDERHIWSNFSKEERLVILEDDPAFDRLQFLSKIIFKQAQKCLQTKIYLNNDVEYAKKLSDIANCLDDIKPQNISMAQEIVSESILDLDYIYEKSDIKSLRLAKIIVI